MLWPLADASSSGSDDIFPTNSNQTGEKVADADKSNLDKSIVQSPESAIAEKLTTKGAVVAILETKETDKGTMLFSRSQSTKEGYEQRIDELFSTEKTIGAIKVLDKSDLLDMLGYRGEPLYLNEKKVIEGRFNHGLTKDHWKKYQNGLLIQQ